MTDTATANPYEPASLPSDATSSGLTRLQSALATLLAIVLLIRGGFMLFSWVMQLSSRFQLDSHFYAAILAKDAIYGISAFLGGLMLLARHKLGWWSAIVHWCWYVACEILVVATGATLGCAFPCVTIRPRFTASSDSLHYWRFAVFLFCFGVRLPLRVTHRHPNAIRLCSQ